MGVHKNKLTISLAINVIASIALLAMFINKNTEDIVFNRNSIYAVTYILVAGIFEMVFIYGFLRYEFERAFGTLPAILFTAFYVTRNISIFLFFWGVGAVWDVFVNSEAGDQIKMKHHLS